MGFAIPDISLRAVNTAFLIIILGLTGSLIHGQHESNSRVNMALFASVFGLVFSSFYGILAGFVSALAWPIVLITVDFLNFVFTFAAATALAVGIRVHSCSNQDYLNGNSVAQGSSDRCRKAQASVAFLYFSFFIFLTNLVLSTLALINGGAFGFKSRGGARGGLPAVAQV